MKILRVFPRRTSQTPTDDLAFVGKPPLFRPEADEVHVSCIFTWDKPEAERIAEHWRAFYPVVRVGGPAYDDPGDEFVAGRYIKPGWTFTSRGCPNDCWFCLVPKREGKLRELKTITPGYKIQDNNLTACSEAHLDRVFSMLATQRNVDFIGGLEAGRITDGFVERLRGVHLYRATTAYDLTSDEQPVKDAVLRLARAGLRKRQIGVYVLVGYEGDTIERATTRLETAWEWGALPFAMLYRDPMAPPVEDRSKGGNLADHQWRELQRMWSRPIAMFAMHKEHHP